MRPLKGLLLVVCAAVGVLALSPRLSQAQDLKPAVIGFIDLKRINAESKAAQAAAAQHKKFSEEFYKNVEEQKQVARRKSDELRQQISVLTPEAYKKQASDLQRREIIFNRNIKATIGAINLSYNLGLGEIEKKAQDITREVAKRKGVNIVMTNFGVWIVMDDNLDLTQDVLDELDKQLPTITLADPATVRNRTGN